MTMELINTKAEINHNLSKLELISILKNNLFAELNFSILE